MTIGAHANPGHKTKPTKESVAALTKKRDELKAQHAAAQQAAEDAGFGVNGNAVWVPNGKEAESNASLDFNGFVERLRKSEASLKGKYNCRAVRFKVVVKNGQTTLKPVPIV